jgi:hypothetical protein
MPFMFDMSWPDISMPGMLCELPEGCCWPQAMLADRKQESRKAIRFGMETLFKGD